MPLTCPKDIGKELGMVKLNTTEILENLQYGSLENKHFYGVALSFNVANAGFRVALPVPLLGSMVDMILQCTVTHAVGEFKCHFKLDVDRFFKATLDQIGNAAVWVVR